MIIDSGLLWKIMRPDAVKIWHYNEVKRRLEHYYNVMENKRPAKYRVVKRIPVEDNIHEMDYKDLWKLHYEKSKEF